MKNKNLKLIAIIMLISVLGLLAEPPRTLTYQGKLTDVGGIAITGTVDITFKIFNVASGGTALWTEAHTSVPVTNGLFDVTLGESTPMDIDFDEQYWIELTVGTEPLSPREKMAAVPYAHRAVYADDGPTNWTLSGDDIYNNNSGNVGIGTSSPDASAILDVFSTDSGILYPRMTTAQRDAISSPATSLLIYNTTTECIETYIGGEWQEVWCEGGLPTSVGDCSGDVYIGLLENSGDGHLPVFSYTSFWEYSRSQTLILREELGTCTGGEITDIYYFISRSESNYVDNVSLYMLETSMTSLPSSGDWLGYGGDLVWSGTLSFASTGWYRIHLSSSFVWDSDNLLICFENSSTDDDIGGNVYVFTSSTSNVLCQRKATYTGLPSTLDDVLWRMLLRITFASD